jgi:uncharacterized RDD family membrane protein YckC
MQMQMRSSSLIVGLSDIIRANERLFSSSSAGIFGGLPGVGFAWAAFSPQRQTLHDLLAGTRLVIDSKAAP